MKDELEAELCKKYPKIFRDARHPDAQVSAMHWGISVGDGWYHVINNGCSLIQHHIDHERKAKANILRYNRAILKAKNGDLSSLRRIFANKDGTMSKWSEQNYDIAAAQLEYKPVPEICKQVIATQVKEKFGSMRFYYEGGDEYVSGIIDLMENMTSTTCDNCGAVGTKGGGGWISVRCAPCRIGFNQTLPDYEMDDGE